MQLMKVAVYSGTRNLYPHMIPAIKSLMANSDVDRIYVLAEDEALSEPLPECCVVKNMTVQKFFPEGSANMKSQFSHMALMRAALAKIFPDMDVVLSLDIDTIAVNDVSQIWDINLDGYYFSACREPHRSHNGLLYTNAGVTLFNLKKLRDDKKVDEMIEVLNRQSFTWVDQDVQNYLCQGRILEMPSCYNANNWTEPTKHPRIVHFAGIKNYFGRKEYLDYKSMSWDDVLEWREKQYGR